jgi:glycosyltransferase involved in cell wall biosynthesis
MKLGIIVRSDKTGLGSQTYELTKMLNPDKVLLINSEHFNQNKQFPELYKDYSVIETARGFPTDKEVSSFLDGLDAVLSCETFYNSNLIFMARKLGIKTLLQYNFEFLDNLKHSDWPLPDVLIAPSLWNFDTVFDMFSDRCKVIYLPPPTSADRFEASREANMASKGHSRILHIAGKIADADRNGTNTVMQMLKYSTADYQLVIKVQNPERLEDILKDPRLSIDTSNPDSNMSLYSGFDAMVLPRRYAGLCLPMNEALMSGLPVFMTDVSPNNLLLPKEWLVQSKQISKIKTRTILPVYEASPRALAELVDGFIEDKNKLKDKEKAYLLAQELFSVQSLKDRYINLISE